MWSLCVNFFIYFFWSSICLGHVECVSILLKAGADKKGTAPDGTSLIDAAEKQEIRDLLAWNDTRTPICLAAAAAASATTTTTRMHPIEFV